MVIKRLNNWLLSVVLMVGPGLKAQPATYCNPLNLDYTYAVYDAARDISYRSGADPAVVRFKGEYYMFVTRSMGYWHSKDLQSWTFIKPQTWYFQGSNAPAAHNYKDSVLYVTGDPSGAMSVLCTDNPKKGDWKALPYILTDLQDPDLFIDDDGQAYMFWGSSNTFPVRGIRLDRKRNFKPIGQPTELFKLHEKQHGWERFGENHEDTLTKGYMEGAWLTKHAGTYYMQYAAPGTEFNVYGDGVYTSKSPLGPYTYAANNPVFYKPGGFINGAGHGSTVLGPANKYWHFGSMSVSVNVNWERRICMYPTWFDKDGMMYSNTEFGDYPHYGPDAGEKSGTFRGWMLLSYKKPVTVSGELPAYPAARVNDENVRSFWVAPANDDKQWIEIDLRKESEIHALQINYHDYKSEFYGRVDGLYHRYRIRASANGREWFDLVDKSESFADSPNDYVEIKDPRRARYIRFENIKAPAKHLSISDLRVFGIGKGNKPDAVKQLSVFRSPNQTDSKLSWTRVSGAQGYNIIWGIAPDKLYNSYLVYDKTEQEIKSLNAGQAYYFSIQAFSENGVSARSPIVKTN